jgi:capsular polysaccharide biosynthesis protein
MTKPSMDFDSINNSHLFSFLGKKKKFLWSVAIATIVISGVVSFLIPEKFKSVAILFPVTSNSISKSLLAENNFQNDDIMEFGAEEQAEQMLQILNSDDIRDRICEKFNLMQHYQISNTDKYKKTKLQEEFQDNINYRLTQFMSVRIEVLDKNADTAALIANEIAALHDTVKIRMQRDRALRALKVVESEYHQKEKEVAIMTDSIKMLNQLGVFDYESQSEVTTEQYAIAIAKGDARAIKSLEEKLKVLADYGSSYVSLRDNLFMQRKQLNLLKTKFEEIKVDAQEAIPQKFVVSRAFAAEKKTYPIIWLIITVSSLSAVLLAALGLLIFSKNN